MEPGGEASLSPWAHWALKVGYISQVLLRGKLFWVDNTSLNLSGKLFQGLFGRLGNLGRTWALVHLSLEWESLTGGAKLPEEGKTLVRIVKQKLRPSSLFSH